MPIRKIDWMIPERIAGQALPIIVDGVSKVYVFMYANYGSSPGGYKLNGGSVEYGGIWSNPAVISLTENSTLSLLHAKD